MTEIKMERDERKTGSRDPNEFRKKKNFQAKLKIKGKGCLSVKYMKRPGKV